MADRAELTVLIIDDDEDAHFLLKRALKKLGWGGRVESCFDGDEAVAYFERDAGARDCPALVFLDVKMPGKNGFDVLRWMGSRSLLDATTVVMLSASEAPSDVESARALGAAEYLCKPAETDALRRALELAAACGDRKSPDAG